MRKYTLHIITLSVLFCTVGFTAKAQVRPSTAIQLTGIALTGDSLYGVPKVSVYVPGTGRRTTGNLYGYFSLAVLPGDTLVISSVGFTDYKYVVQNPENEKNTLYQVFVLTPDIIMLPEVAALPYRTEREFKEAFLDLDIPQTDFENMLKNLDKNLMAMLLEETPVDGGINHSNYMSGQVYSTQNRFVNPLGANPLLNPFAWANLIKDIKAGKFKKKK